MTSTPERDVAIPVSSGIPPVVKWAVLCGVALILMIGAIAIGTSNYHHIWPAPDTTHIKLGT